MYAMQHVTNDGDFSMEDETGEDDSNDQPFPVGEMGEPWKPVSGRHPSIGFPFSSLPAGIELSWQR